MVKRLASERRRESLFAAAANATLRWLSRLVCAVGFAALLSPAFAAEAQYPRKPVRLIVPFPAGGTTDVLGRAIGNKLSAALKQQFVIDNRPGAAGNLGSALAARAQPDGYTLLLGTVSSHAINPSLYARLPYDALKDFTPVALLVTMPNVLTVNPGVQARSVKELIALAKAKPGMLTFASGGNGTTHHLSGELFKSMAGVDMTHVPYKGNAPALADVMSGQVHIMFDNIGNCVAQIRAGRLRALAVTGQRRSPALPDIPTMVEAGFVGYEATSWFGLFAPAGTPKIIVDTLNREVNQVLRDPEVVALFARTGMEAKGGSSTSFEAFVKSELARWAKIVRDSGARID